MLWLTFFNLYVKRSFFFGWLGVSKSYYMNFFRWNFQWSLMALLPSVIMAPRDLTEIACWGVVAVPFGAPANARPGHHLPPNPDQITLRVVIMLICNFLWSKSQTHSDLLTHLLSCFIAVKVHQFWRYRTANRCRRFWSTGLASNNNSACYLLVS